MKISLSLLKKFIAIDASPEEIAEQLTLAGIEVDAIENATPSFTNVVAALVQSAEPHPNADRLTIATVFDGKETLQVVCGAPNCREGIKTALARIGAELEDDNHKKWKIKKSKLRDVDSYGMLCTKKELKISKEADGIMELPEEIPVGQDLSVLCDPIFEISLTPNLGHCLSALGIARELAALTKKTVNLPKFKIQEATSDINETVTASIEAAKHCSRYSLRKINGVKVGPSPFWLQRELESCGMRSINSIVDVTNYVMLQIGQPMHAFDFDKIEGSKVSVKLSEKPFDFECLDGSTRRVPPSTLLICDAQKPIALGGIMGGSNSAVDEKTTTVLLEAASFDPVTIRKASKQMNLRSESSQRFERGTDLDAVLFALDYAAYLIQEISGGTIEKNYVDEITLPIVPRKILCRLDRVNSLIGMKFSMSEVEEIFQRLECKTTLKDPKILEVTIPTYRNDLHLEVDLIEEVARIYGYNNLKRKPALCQTSKIAHAPLYLFENLLRNILISEGLQELMTCDLISPSLANLIHDPDIPKDSIIEVLHSKSLENSILRPSLLPGLLEVARYNFDHKNFAINGFEIGRIHFKKEEAFIEQSMMSIILSGPSYPLHWSRKTEDFDFYDLKGILENLFSILGIPKIQFAPAKHPNFHPYRQANILLDGIELGVMGEIHPKKIESKQKIFFSECNLQLLMQKQRKIARFSTISPYPASERDWTISLKEEVLLSDVLKMILEVPTKLLEHILCLNVYRSEHLGKGNKNLTLRFIYRDSKRTVSYDEVEKEHLRITSFVADSLSL